jgi:alkylation response protein AidB-like acyl-CoA dehydrogenase
VTPATATTPVLRARALADELLRPAAETVDQTVVPRSHLDAWAAAGLMGLAGSSRARRRGAPPAVVREVVEVLAGACGATWFVATQHALPLATLAGSDNRALQDRLLPGLCTGEVLSGVAVAHLRRPGPPLSPPPARRRAGASTATSAG